MKRKKSRLKLVREEIDTVDTACSYTEKVKITKSFFKK